MSESIEPMRTGDVVVPVIIFLRVKWATDANGNDPQSVAGDCTPYADFGGARWILPSAILSEPSIYFPVNLAIQEDFDA